MFRPVFRPVFLLAVAAGGVSAVLPAVGAAHATDIYIVDTVDRAATGIFGEAFQRSCGSCGTIRYRQMGGNMRTARKIASELLEEEKAGRLSLVITLGRPATRVLAERLVTTPILYTFVGGHIEDYAASPNVVGLPTDASLSAQVRLLTRLLPGLKSVGIVVGNKRKHADLSSGEIDDIAVNIYRIADRQELPSALRTAVQQNDGLIFLRDRMVINKDSVRFVMRHTLENRRHTIAYSKSLVDMGLAAALVPRPEAFGHKLGQAAEQYLRSGRLQALQAGEADYHIHLNQRVIDQLAQEEKSLMKVAAELVK